MKKENRKANNKNITAQNPFSQKRYWAWAGVLTILSLLFNSNSFDAYFGTRFLALGLLLAVYAVFFLGILKKKNVVLRSKPVQLFFVIGAVFFLWSVICSLTAITIGNSFVPLAFMLCFGLSTFFVMESLPSAKAIQKLLSAFSFLMLFHAIVAFLQIFDIAFLDIPGSDNQPNGLMGNRNIFGSFLAMGFWFPAYLASIKKGGEKWLYAGIAFVLLLGGAISQTRTVWLSMLITFCLFPVAWRWVFGKQNTNIKGKAVIGGVAIIVFAILSFAYTSPKTYQRFKIRMDETFSIKVGDPTKSKRPDNSIAIRWWTWKNSMKMAADHPIMGVGPGNWKLAIPAYGSVGFVNDTGERVLAKAHNTYIEVLCEVGVLGLVLFLLLFTIVAWAAHGVLFSDRSEEEKKTVFFLSMILVGFILDMLSNFSSLRVEHMFLLSFVFGSIFSLREKGTPATNIISIKKNLLGLLTIAISSFAIIIGLANNQFDIDSKAVRDIEKTKNYDALLKKGEQSKSSIIKNNYLSFPIEIYTAMGYMTKGQFQKAEVEIKKAAEYSPNNALVYSNWGGIYASQNNFTEAIKYFNKALELTPKNPEILRHLMMAYHQIGDCKNALEVYERPNFESTPIFEEIKIKCQGK